MPKIPPHLIDPNVDWDELEEQLELEEEHKRRWTELHAARVRPETKPQSPLHPKHRKQEDS